MIHDTETQGTFIALRAKGVSFDKIAEQLNVSKKTLLGWAMRYRNEISAFRLLRLEAIRDQLECTKEKRTELLSGQLKSLLDELSKRNFKRMTDTNLLNLVLKFTLALRREEQTPDPAMETKKITSLYQALPNDQPANQDQQDPTSENYLTNPNFFYHAQKIRKSLRRSR